MRTTEAVIGKWNLVFDHYELPPITHKKHFKGESPCCNRKGKFRIDDKNGRGTFICACGASGNGWELLRIKTGKEFKTLAREVDQIIGNSYKHEAKKPKRKDYREDIKRSSPIKNTNVERYLNKRGIYELPKKAAVALDGNMYCIAVDEYINPVYKHVTYLEGDNKKERKMYSINECNSYGVIRLFDCSETLGIAEGVETALAAKQVYKVNTWSTMNATNMTKFRAPQGVKRLIIFADNDKNGTGLASAFACANANVLSNNDVVEVIVRWCSTVNDFNDMLAEGSEVHEWRLSK